MHDSPGTFCRQPFVVESFVVEPDVIGSRVQVSEVLTEHYHKKQCSTTTNRLFKYLVNTAFKCYCHDITATNNSHEYYHLLAKVHQALHVNRDLDVFTRSNKAMIKNL